MISKEERAELRLGLSNISLGFPLPLPWRLGEYADVIDADGLMGPWLVEWKDGEGKWHRTPADYSICALIERRMKEWGVPIPALPEGGEK